MAVGSKYVASDMVLEWTPDGSTTVTSFGGYGRGFSIDESMDSADATGYGNDNRQYQPTIGDFQPSCEIMLEDGYVIEALFTKGAKGTLDAYPNGKVSTKKKISCPVFVSNRSRSYPYDDIAVMTVDFMPTGDSSETTVT